MSRPRRASAMGSQQSPDVEADEADVEMQDRADAEDSDVDAEGEDDDDGNGDMFKTIANLSTWLCEVEEDGEELASGFQRIPNRRALPDYFEVISDPIAFSTVRHKIQKKLYTSFAEFVRDVAQICHNAQVYNRPSAPIFGAAVRLRELFKEKLQEYASKGRITAEEAVVPDLGEIPDNEDSPPESEGDEADQDEDEEEEEEEEEEDDDDSDDEGGRRRGRRNRGRASRRDRDDDKDEEAHKKRGRPPSVLTPMEARIASIIRGLRKNKGEDGQLLILPFEKLPDKTVVTDYYQTITNPIALDHIKKKAKRKKYQNVDMVLADIELMFENAKTYNEDDSPLHQAAVELQKQARELAEQEKAKPDEDFRDEDGKLPLSEIHYKNESWRVGDWVHIRNPNDLGKPIVAQIYRTWQDRDGQRWINACWYYRPEQTVHRFDKHFFDHEVVKTGQYRDHQIEDVLDRCFVMFVTRFGRGRPRGFPRDKEVYVCEARYNEELFRFAKIKTWASCVPDEVRERDYEMDLFDGPPRRLHKMPSPIKHLLREDAKETDDLPKPTWGSPNAPPIVGAVHRRPRAANESPPPEPTPPPPPVVEAPVDRRPSMLPAAQQAQDMSMRSASMSFTPGPGPSPSPNQYQAHMAQTFQPGTPGMGGPPMHQSPVPVPQAHHSPHPPQMQMRSQYNMQGYVPNAAPGYPHSPAQTMHQPIHNMPQGYQQGPPPASRGGMNPAMGGNMYNPPRPPEVYTLPDAVNEAFPEEVRQQFQTDGQGRVLFFTAPPLDRSSTKGLSKTSAGLGHSAKYLAGRQEWLEERAKKRKARDEEKEKARKKSPTQSPAPETKDQMVEQAAKVIGNWFKGLDKEAARWQKEAGLNSWKS